MVMLRGAVIVALLLALPSAAHHHEHMEELCSKLERPNKQFALDLFNRLRASKGATENIFFSPLSISTALSMLAAGAAGDTHTQVFDVMGYSKAGLTQAQVNEAYEHAFHMLKHGSGTMKLLMTNAMAIGKDFAPADQFAKDIKKFYSGETLDVDFSDGPAAVAKINGYIAKATSDKITDLVKDLDAATVMMLLSAINFEAKWEDPFKASDTFKDDFNVNENTKVKVDMMKKDGYYEFYQDPENFTSVIELPYQGNASMMIVLPDEGKMAEVVEKMSDSMLQHWHSSLSGKQVDLFMPKFEISAEASLKPILKDMGMINAFEANADLSGISQSAPLKVSKITHKAVLKVDEDGTEAAAATAVEINLMAMPFPNEQFKINRPFLIFICEHGTKSVPFMGQINDPTAA